MRDCEARILLVDEAHVSLIPALRSLVPELRTAVVIRTARDAEIAIGQWLARAPVPDDMWAGGDTRAPLLYTSGTTGRLNGVMLGHADLLASAQDYFGFPGAPPGSRYLRVTPLFHVESLSAVFASLLAGSTHVFLPQSDPAAVLATI